jgi:hypothetical protein
MSDDLGPILFEDLKIAVDAHLFELIFTINLQRFPTMSRSKKNFKKTPCSHKPRIDDPAREMRLQLWRLRQVADRYKVTRHPDLATHFRVLIDQMQANASITDIIGTPSLHKRYLEALEIMAVN